nr:hypothetical protein [Nitrospirota bacterium]
MAELNSEFIAETLTSRQLLALLFVCESQRKHTLGELNLEGGPRSTAWTEFLDRFGARLAKLPEPEKVYLLGSHLQSAEEIDIYDNDAVHGLLTTHHDLLAKLTGELDKDPRFVR